MYGLYMDCESHLSRKICEKLYLNAEMTDVSFVFETEVVPAHKFILATGSSVFKAMFYGPLRSESNKITIEDATADEFKQFLQFFYIEEVHLSPTNIMSIINLCQRFDLMDALISCAKSLKSSLSNDDVCWGYAIALSINDQGLIDFCEKMIEENIDEVFDSDSFLQCDGIVMEKILNLLLFKRSATEVATGCMKWAKAKCGRNDLLRTPTNLRESLGELFHRIPFDKFTTVQFTEFTQTYKRMFNPSEINIIMDKIKDRVSNMLAERNLQLLSTVNGDREIEGEIVTTHCAGDIFTAFSTNGQLVLKEFYAKLPSPAKFYDEIPYDITTKWAKKTELISSGIAIAIKDSDQLHVILPKPLVIETNKLHLINIYSYSSDSIDLFAESYDHPKLKKKITVEDVEITFKTNSRFECDSVTCLVFKKKL